VPAAVENHDPDAPTVLPAGGPNAIGQMLGLLGDEWNLLIIRQAIMGATHYAQFLSQLSISNSVLTHRLRNLVASGLLARRVHPTARARTEYLLTARSRSLWTVMLLMWAWDRDWVDVHQEKVLEMYHKACGQAFTPVLRCRGCGATVTHSDVALALGPSGSWDRSTPAAATRRRTDHDPELYPETMSVFGNRWAAALLVASFLGTTRFTEFQAQLGAPPSSLAERLQTFSRIGVLTTSARGGAPTEEWGSPRLEYVLTEKGKAFFPVLAGVITWAQYWFRAADGPAVLLTHKGCGARFRGELVCDHCLTLVETGVVWR